jgi:hypothetical protein
VPSRYTFATSAGAVSGTGDVQHREVIALDDAVQVRVNQIEAGARSPVPEQPRLDVLAAQRFPQQRVIEEVDLPDGEVVRGAPVGVDAAQFVRRKRVRGHRCSFG